MNIQTLIVRYPDDPHHVGVYHVQNQDTNANLSEDWQTSVASVGETEGMDTPDIEDAALTKLGHLGWEFVEQDSTEVWMS